MLIYFGRLFDFVTPGDYVSLIPPILYGFVVHPVFYVWLGLIFPLGRARGAAATGG